MKLYLGFLLIICVFVWAAVGYVAWVRYENLKKPCVPYYPGMTLEPGQCATMKMELRAKP